jgi:hypothetical protein
MYASAPRSTAFAPTAVQPVDLRPLACTGVVRERERQYETGPGGPRYESEGSERRTLGSVSVSENARWTATLTVPIPERNVAFVEFERRGALPAGYRGSEEYAHLSLPLDEVDAVVSLLAGMVDQARHDGVLPPRQDRLGE